MSRRVLVLNGPTLSLTQVLGEPLDALNQRLAAAAQPHGLSLEFVQANGEGALIDTLVARNHGLFAVIVNPASLASVAYGLADALEALKLKAIEVQLEHEAKGRGRSALRRVVDKQFHGQGTQGYFKALEAVAKDVASAGGSVEVSMTQPEAPEKAVQAAPNPPAVSTRAQVEAVDDEDSSEDDAGDDELAAPRPTRAGKSIGRRPAAPPTPLARLGKSIGRREPSAAPTPTLITRQAVKEHVAARLAKKLSPDGFALWARNQWSAIQRGAATEAGYHGVLEEVLLVFAASAKASEHTIISAAARLES